MILSVPFYPYHFIRTILSVYHFFRYHFVLERFLVIAYSNWHLESLWLRIKSYRQCHVYSRPP